MIWKNDSSLDKYLAEESFTSDPERADIFLVGASSFDVPTLNNLKAIFRLGVGDDNIPYEKCKERGIKVVFPSEKTKSFIYEETANFSCYLAFYLLYRDKYDFLSWSKERRICLNQLNVLIVGKGNIGNRVYKKLSSFFKVDYYDIMEHKIRDLDSKIEKADIISLHLPAVKENICFWNSDKLNKMKERSVLINASRGAIVDEDALYYVLKEKDIKVGFDTFWEEPYKGKLLEFYPEKFYASPHVASTCDQFLDGAAKDFKKLYFSIKGN